MPSTALPWRRLRGTMIAGNLLGAILTFFYFRVVDPVLATAAGPVSVREIAISAAAFAALVAVGQWLGQRWMTPLATFQGSDTAAPSLSPRPCCGAGRCRCPTSWPATP